MENCKLFGFIPMNQKKNNLSNALISWIKALEKRKKKKDFFLQICSKKRTNLLAKIPIRGHLGLVYIAFGLAIQHFINLCTLNV